MTKRVYITVGAVLAVALLATAALAQPGFGRGWGGGPRWAAPGAQVDEEYAAKATELHQKIRQLRWDIYALEQAKADQGQIDAKKAELTKLQDELHQLNVERGPLGPAGVGAWGMGGRWGQAAATPAGDETAAKVAELHQKIRELNWEIYGLQQAKGDQAAIDAKMAERDRLRDELHQLMVEPGSGPASPMGYCFRARSGGGYGWGGCGYGRMGGGGYGRGFGAGTGPGAYWGWCPYVR